MRDFLSNIGGRLSRTTAAWKKPTVEGRYRDPAVWLIACGCLLVAMIFLGTVMMAGEFRERALVNTQRELENTVLLLTRHFDQQFADAETVTADLIAQMRLPEIPTPEAFRQRMSTPETHEMLKFKLSRLAYLGNVSIADADGNIINWSADEPFPAINISQRAYFKTLKTDPRSPVVIEAVRSYVNGALTTILSHRLEGADGVFLGVLSRRVDPANYETFFASVAFGTGGAISMFHLDGTMIARYPHVEHMIGKKLAHDPLLKGLSQGDRRQLPHLRSPVDQQDRISAAGALHDFPIAVIATRTNQAALADWRAQTRFLVIAAIVTALIIALILLLIIRQIARQSREAQGRIETERQRLDTALNNMTQGLVLYDAGARVVTTNQRYIDMHGLSADVVRPGLPFRELIAHRKATGSFDGYVDEFCASVLRNVARGEVNVKILECMGGRAFQIVNKPLPQGGWIATIEDITERRALEQERDRNFAFLREIIDHIPSQITVKDVRDRRYLLVNRVTEQQFGASRDAIVGKTAYDLFPPAAADKITQDDDRTLPLEGGLFLDERPWHSQALGKRYITSHRMAIRDETDSPRCIVHVVEDVTERRLANERIAHLAHYDALTDLPNRVLFREHTERELRQLDEGGQFALLYIDIDEFKGINDSLGHHVGDELLKSVAGRIRDCLEPDDLVARLGGDEFAVIRTAIKGVDDVNEFVTRLYAAIRLPCECLGHQLATDASIGIVLAPRDGDDLDQLIKNADLAMYAAKAGGRRTYRFFEPAMDASAKARLSLERDLRQAMTDGGFEVHYQPLVNFQSNEVTGCEALLRWRHPARGMISPTEFIPLAEDTGLIVELGDWVLRTACAEAATWPDHVKLAVNVSPVQLRCPTLALRITSALETSGLRPHRLEVEITEAVLIRDDEAALAVLHQLRAIGVRIALDDFGTGFSSLSYLKRFPFDKIKIDRCFVSDISETDGSSSIVQAVVNIAMALNMTTVAEGVETEAQRELLRRLGCTEMQGYLFSPPEPPAAVRKLFGARDGWMTSAAIAG